MENGTPCFEMEIGFLNSVINTVLKCNGNIDVLKKINNYY